MENNCISAFVVDSLFVFPPESPQPFLFAGSSSRDIKTITNAPRLRLDRLLATLYDYSSPSGIVVVFSVGSCGDASNEGWGDFETAVSKLWN